MRNDIRPRLEVTLTQFRDAVGYQGKLEVLGPSYLYDDPNGQQKYPGADDAGCYIFADGSGTIHYVGKGSRFMGNRIWAPFGRRGKQGETDDFPNAKDWVKQGKPDIGVWAIAIIPEHWWLAAALEGFLIENLEPTANKKQR